MQVALSPRKRARILRLLARTWRRTYVEQGQSGKYTRATCIACSAYFTDFLLYRLTPARPRSVISSRQSMSAKWQASINKS
jgi:hypothetical protein